MAKAKTKRSARRRATARKPDPALALAERWRRQLARTNAAYSVSDAAGNRAGVRLSQIEHELAATRATSQEGKRAKLAIFETAFREDHCWGRRHIDIIGRLGLSVIADYKRTLTACRH